MVQEVNDLWGGVTPQSHMQHVRLSAPCMTRSNNHMDRGLATATHDFVRQAMLFVSLSSLRTTVHSLSFLELTSTSPWKAIINRTPFLSITSDLLIWTAFLRPLHLKLPIPPINVSLALDDRFTGRRTSLPM